MAMHALAATAVPVERTARTAVRILILGSLMVKAGGFSWDFLAASAALAVLACLPLARSLRARTTRRGTWSRP